MAACSVVTLVRVGIVLTALWTLPFTLAALAVSARLREWFFGFAFFPLLSRSADRMFADKKRALFKDHGLKGKILDLGSGLGANFKYYNDFDADISRIVAVEPNQFMQGALMSEVKRVLASPFKVDFFHGTLEKFIATRPTEVGTFDFVVSTMTLCSVDNVHDNVKYINLLLKPGGKLLAVEHVAAPIGTVAAVVQRLISPLWRQITGSCNLDHETDKELKHMHSFETHLEPAGGLLAPFVAGYAVKTARD